MNALFCTQNKKLLKIAIYKIINNFLHVIMIIKTNFLNCLNTHYIA